MVLPCLAALCRAVAHAVLRYTRVTRNNSTRSLLVAFKGRDADNVSLTTSVALDLEALEYYYTATDNSTAIAQPQWQQLSPGSVCNR